MAYEHSGHGLPPPPRYVMLSENGGSESMALRPPAHRRNLPRYHSHRDRGGGGCCCGCLCWFCCFLFLILAALAGAATYVFFLLKPKPPSYSVTDMSVASFDFSSSDFSLYTKLVASVRAENPNDMIGIKYGDGSRTVVSYRGTTLCSGRLPSFYQGYRNTTVLKIAMEGRHGFGSGLQEAMEESEKAGHVPLDVYVSVPVSLRLGSVELREVTVNVHCALVVDSLSPKKKPAIKSAEYKVNAEF